MDFAVGDVLEVFRAPPETLMGCVAADFCQRQGVLIAAISAAISECEHNAADGKKMRNPDIPSGRHAIGCLAVSLSRQSPILGDSPPSLLAIHPIAFSRSSSEFPEAPLSSNLW